MSAYRIPGPDGRIVLVLADEGMTPYRHGTYIGGSLVTERKAAPLPVPATNEATRARMAAYKAARKAQLTCGRVMHTGEPCGRPQGHRTGCQGRATMDRNAARRRTTR